MATRMSVGADSEAGKETVLGENMGRGQRERKLWEEGGRGQSGYGSGESGENEEYHQHNHILSESNAVKANMLVYASNPILYMLIKNI